MAADKTMQELHDRAYKETYNQYIILKMTELAYGEDSSEAIREWHEFRTIVKVVANIFDYDPVYLRTSIERLYRIKEENPDNC